MTKETHHIRLRRATLDDAALLMEWRNDAETLENSTIGWRQPVEMEGHRRWLQATIDGKYQGRILTIAENEEGEPVGTVRCDLDPHGEGEVYELSYTTAPKWRGKGYGVAMNLQFVRVFLPGKKLLCKIKKGHRPSEKIAEALGLHPISEEPSSPGDPRPLVSWR